MMYTAVFALMAVGLAAASQEYVMYTNGRGSDEICGKYHLCSSDASCQRVNVHDSSLKMCVCKDELRGNGKLYCKDPLDKTLYIQNDPHVKNFYEEFANLPSPCRYRLAHLVMVPSVDATAQVELFGENMLFKGGEYYLSKMTLSLNLILAGDMMKQTMEFYGDVSSDGLNYTLVAKSLEAEGFTIGEELSILNLEKESFKGYTMIVGKDDINNLLKVTIPNLGITLMFRPPSIKEELDNTLLPMVPGAVFVVDHKKWDLVKVDESDFEISSWPQGPSLVDMASQLEMPEPLFIQYLMLNNTLSTPIYNDEVCLESGRIFREECGLESDRRMMLEMCTPLYTNKDFLKLITEVEIADNFAYMQKKFFERCELAFCSRDREACVTLKTDLLEEFKEDKLPQVIRDIDCDSIVVSEPKPELAMDEPFIPGRAA